MSRITLHLLWRVIIRSLSVARATDNTDLRFRLPPSLWRPEFFDSYYVGLPNMLISDPDPRLPSEIWAALHAELGAGGTHRRPLLSDRLRVTNVIPALCIERANNMPNDERHFFRCWTVSDGKMILF